MCCCVVLRIQEEKAEKAEKAEKEEPEACLRRYSSLLTLLSYIHDFEKVDSLLAHNVKVEEAKEETRFGSPNSSVFLATQARVVAVFAVVCICSQHGISSVVSLQISELFSRC